MPGKKRFGSMAADREQADAGQRQQRAGLHVLGAHAVEQRVLVRMQAPADRFAVGERVAERRQPRVVGRRSTCSQSAIVQAATGSNSTIRTRSPWKSSASAAAIARTRVGGVVLAQQRQRQLVRAHGEAFVFLRVANSSCRRRDSSRFLSRSTSSW